jgi:peptidoglycan hydrolase-like protein with peptidoglycan-binding domain
MKIIKLTESDLKHIVKKVLIEQRAVPSAERGQKNDDTRQIQQALKLKGYKLGNSGPNNDCVDGDFGPATQRAVKDFQTRMKLRPTGVVDQQTRNYLFAGFANSQFLSTLPGATTLQKSTGTKTTGVKSTGEKTTGVKTTASKTDKVEEMFLDCVKNSPKKKVFVVKDGSTVILIDGHYFFSNSRVKMPNGKMGTYFCYENGVKIKDPQDKKTYVETGVETKREKTSRFSGGIEGFFRKSFPNVAQIFNTKPLTGEDFTESQKQVVFNVIQNAINKRKQDRNKGCTEYIDYNEDIDQQLNKNGGATTAEMVLGSGFSDEFRVATLLGRFCYTLQPNGSYLVKDDYDFHKWKSFTVSKGELDGMSYPEKIGYIMDKTDLSPYGAIRHIGYLEHPAEAPAATKTKIVLNIDSGYFAKNDKKTKSTTGSVDDTLVA